MKRVVISGIGIISASCFGILALVMHQYDVAIIAFSLMGALCSFLKYNFPPAKLFMGDTGSLLVGMTLSVLAINLIRTGFVTEEFSFSQHGPILAIVFLANSLLLAYLASQSLRDVPESLLDTTPVVEQNETSTELQIPDEEYGDDQDIPKLPVE